jgi:hypothetical protein
MSEMGHNLPRRISGTAAEVPLIAATPVFRHRDL